MQLYLNTILDGFEHLNMIENRDHVIEKESEEDLAKIPL